MFTNKNPIMYLKINSDIQSTIFTHLQTSTSASYYFSFQGYNIIIPLFSKCVSLSQVWNSLLDNSFWLHDDESSKPTRNILNTKPLQNAITTKGKGRFLSASEKTFIKWILPLPKYVLDKTADIHSCGCCSIIFPHSVSFKASSATFLSMPYV